MSTKRLIRISLFTAIALILSLLEGMLPPLLSFAPGVKMGLANTASFIALIVLGWTDAFIVLLVRCLLMSIFGNNISALMYSLPAGIAALTVQTLLYKFVFPRISLMSISTASAVMHNFMQLFMATIIIKANLFSLLPLTLTASIIAGLFVGIVTWFTVKYLPKSVILEKA